MVEQIILAVLILKVAFIFVQSVTSTITVVPTPLVTVLVVWLIWIQGVYVMGIETVLVLETDEIYSIKYEILDLSNNCNNLIASTQTSWLQFNCLSILLTQYETNNTIVFWNLTCSSYPCEKKTSSKLIGTICISDAYFKATI